MALVVKIPASEVPVKPKDIDLDFFNKNIFDTSKEDEIIMFDGDLDHCHTVPKEDDRRVVLVANCHCSSEGRAGVL